MQGVCAGCDQSLWEARDTEAHSVAQAAALPLASRSFPSPKDKARILLSAGHWILHPESGPATPGHQVSPLSLNFPICIVGAITGTGRDQ